MAAPRLRLAGGLTAAAVYAVVALFAGLDRISESDPAVASAIPWPFRINAVRAIAAQAIAENRPAEAIAYARTAVSRDPANVEAVAVLGQGQLLANRQADALATYTVARELGWREPSTQIFWMLDALGRKDFVQAGQRLDAVLRQAPKFAQRDAMLAMFEGWPDGRDQIARRLALNPSWKRAYFQDLAALQPTTLYLRGEVARSLARYDGENRDCTLVAPLVWEMPQKLGYAEAHDVWRDYCQGGKTASAVADPGFENVRLTRPITPFDWRFPERGEIEVIAAPESGFSGTTLTVSSTAPGRRSFGKQLVRLAPGGYRASWRALDSDRKPSADITLSVSCTADAHDPVPARVAEAEKGLHVADFAVPGGCETQWLDIAIAGQGGPVTLDDVRIDSAAPRPPR